MNKDLEAEYINEQDNFTCIEIDNQFNRYVRELE